jgi:hypothetical protein
VRGDAHAGFGGRAGETDQPQGWHRAPARPYDEAQFAALVASSWVDLHQPTKARPLLDNALRGMDPHYVRDRAIYHARSAHAHVHAAELEPACDDLLTAAGLARQTGSARVRDKIRDARAGMSRYDHEPRVQELDRHLADLTA